MVAVHSHVRQKSGADIAVVHILRFEWDKIIEMWDVGLVVPDDSPNENGVFWQSPTWKACMAAFYRSAGLRRIHGEKTP